MNIGCGIGTVDYGEMVLSGGIELWLHSSEFNGLSGQFMEIGLTGGNGIVLLT